MVVIKIKNLLLRTIIGFNEWERKKKQDVIINVSIEFDASKAIDNDDVEFSLDYKTVCKKIIKLVEASDFNLIETLAHAILKFIMGNKKVKKAVVEVDKPQALRFTESVSVTVMEER